MAQKPSKGKKSLVAKNAPKNADVTRISSGVSRRALVERREARISIGPLPPPDELKKYEEALRGTGKVIVEEFRRNSQHRRTRQWGACVCFVIVVAMIGFLLPVNYSPFAMVLSLGLFLNFLHKN